MQKKSHTNLKNLIETYDELTAEISTLKVLDMMDTEKLNHFLMLLNIADSFNMGKSKSIIYAFKLGYLEGKKQNENSVN